MLTSANRSPTRRQTRCLSSALYRESRDSSVKKTPLQSARRHRMRAFAHSSWLQRHACRWASLKLIGFWQFVQKFFGYANRLLQQLSGWLVSDEFGGEYAGCGDPGLVWLRVVCGSAGRYDKKFISWYFSKLYRFHGIWQFFFFMHDRVLTTFSTDWERKKLQ